ncbi:hypothetical protein EYF80_037375 [Liparis tanakae]|uniref:Uncharacterized protein n=1 Tax=Liparis tanakae TaxID=230148 RepID=A0A4Z2GH08_9TELE|nr:hypothetical protein EYF80_037375 [Liparis tanakae]
MLLYMLPFSTSRLTRMMQQSSTCWFDSVEYVDTADTERLCEREADSGVEEETEEEDALLEPEAEPDVSREEREPPPTFLSCPSGESDRKLAFTSSRSDPLELTERFMMPPFFLARSVLLADSDRASISQDRL